MFACPEEENKCGRSEMLHSCMLFCFPSLHLALFVLTVQSLSQAKAQGRVMEGPQRALNGTLVPNGGLMCGFLCVFQGSAGAQPSGEGEDNATVRFVGAPGEPAGKPGS